MSSNIQNDLRFLQVMILLTDGNQTGTDLVPNQTPLVDAIQPIKDLDVKVIAIGIGSVDIEQLRTLVTDNDDILQPSNFTELLKYVKKTIGISCRGMSIYSRKCTAKCSLLCLIKERCFLCSPWCPPKQLKDFFVRLQFLHQFRQ